MKTMFKVSREGESLFFASLAPPRQIKKHFKVQHFFSEFLYSKYVGKISYI